MHDLVHNTRKPLDIFGSYNIVLLLLFTLYSRRELCPVLLEQFLGELAALQVEEGQGRRAQ